MRWLSPKTLAPAEMRWIACYGMLLGLLTTLPYVIFYFMTPASDHYTWASVFYHDDYYQYYAWANRIASGDWTIGNYYTANPESSYALFNPFFLVLGWVTRLSGNVYFSYHLLRVVGVFAFTWISYCFIAQFFCEIWKRRVMQVIILGGGLEYLFSFIQIYILNSETIRPPTPLADPYIFKILYRYGHLTAALCLQLVIFGSWLQYFSINTPTKRDSVNFVIVLALLITTLGLINPYYLTLVGLVLGIHLFILMVSAQKVYLVALSALICGAIIPVAQYAMQSVTGNLGSITFDEPIGLFDLLLFYAPFLPWAILGGVACWRQHKPVDVFLLTWAMVVIVLVLTPLRFKARMTFGLSFPIAALAVWGVSKLAGDKEWRSLKNLPLVLLLCIGPVFTFMKEHTDFTGKGSGRIPHVILDSLYAVDAAADPDDLLLTFPELGNVVPAYTKLRVWAGHSFQTEDYEAKLEFAHEFFGTPSAERRMQMLAQVDPDFVLVPPTVGMQNPAFHLPGWRVIDQQNGFVIFQAPSIPERGGKEL